MKFISENKKQRNRPNFINETASFVDVLRKK